MATTSVPTHVPPATDLERFAYVASHDMAEPLRMISGYLDLIRESYGSQLDADFDEFISLAVDGADRMLGYLESLRTYSRIGRLENERERVELRALVDEALTRLAPEIEASGAEISVCSLPAVVCERGQMTLVFENLLSNAIKFGGPDHPRVEMLCEPLPEGVEISVIDDGIGIEPADEERAFAMLERLNGQQYPGTGMGLAIARKAIERHGGAIWLEPGRLRGSVFRFSLPYLQTAG
jgi:light-regulated signal transduction histidine kinase (bacteriophytochrome)